MKYDKNIILRIDDETKDKLKELAKGENRTISNYIRTLIEKEYRKYETWSFE